MLYDKASLIHSVHVPCNEHLFPSLASFPRFDVANLRLRVLSAALLMPVILLAVWLGGLAYAALLTCVAAVGFYEWARLVAPLARVGLVGAGGGLVIAVMVAGTVFSVAFGAMLGVVATLVLFLIAARVQGLRAGWIALGMPYMGGSGLALLDLRATPDIGMGLVFYVLAAVWGTDIGAFIAGRLIGGPKLAPALSPSKTWAGLAGGMALAVIFGYFVAAMLGARHPAVTLVLSPVLAVVAQIGDLFESSFKRRSGVKESGGLIPGHGGILDRIDGLVFAAVFADLFEAAIGKQMNWW